MNKKELIQEVAIRSGMSQADVERVLNHITDTVLRSLLSVWLPLRPDLFRLSKKRPL